MGEIGCSNIVLHTSHNMAGAGLGNQPGLPTSTSTPAPSGFAVILNACAAVIPTNDNK
jgi:hypothetical protein